MKKLLILTLMSFGVLCTSTFGFANGVTNISLTPPGIFTVQNSNVFFGVNISNVIDLYAFQFDVSFDPSILSASSVTEGTLLPTGGPTIFIPGTIDNTAGTITFTTDTLIGALPGVSGTGTLAFLSFVATDPGISPVNLSNVTLLNSSLSDIPFSISGATVNVVSSAAVPEPTTMLLLGSGLIGLMGLGRRFKK